MKQEVYIYSQKSVKLKKHNATIFYFDITKYESMVMYCLCYERI